MYILSKFGFNYKRGRGSKPTKFQHVLQESPSLFMLRHRGFDTVPQHQKQRWLSTKAFKRVYHALHTGIDKCLIVVSKSSSQGLVGKRVCSVRNDS
jgi:hypothetical protein